MHAFARIKACEIMQAHLVKLYPSMPIESAIQTLEENEIGGAPVVDESGRTVGILTKSDVTRVEHVRAGRIAATGGDWSLAEPVGEVDEDEVNEDLILEKEDYSPALRGTDTVADWMNPRVVTVGPDASLKEVCRKMLRERIHRVIVADHGKLQGIVTSFDVVRCVAESA